MTPEARDAIKALGELHSVRQGIGAIVCLIDRCKPGSKLHQERLKALEELEHKAFELADVVYLYIHICEERFKNELRSNKKY